ncbi:hypothetical protein [Novosphingobium beihaiensis]|uniref:AttH domain-containing protein n=1 Tax=Novosphingobium beihaiensis TaxID=2930389 RepID=A0ABT0BUU4_9SPHN|nr:hypothetical protein [Novosphingobium beihaiensis]MCJ2188807.1 hypothetical protein [Novosphingobium beihaiensis]
MKIENPTVTLDDEARAGVEEDVRSGFLDWLFQFSVTDGDGEIYSVGGSILSLALENMDIVSINCAKGKGHVEQLPNSIYKIVRYPGMHFERLLRKPHGALKIEKGAESVVVTCGDEYRVECFADHSWHLSIDSLDGEYRAELYHRPHGFPLWYGRDKPSYLTQHSITYGYNWAGDVEGTIYLKGRAIRVKGAGIRERYVAVDSSAAELGGWEDWGFVAFNEIHSSMYDMRLGMKDFSIYDLETQRHYPEGEMIITHEDWAFMRELDGFIPTVYKIRIQVADGTYEVRAHVCNATVWGVTFKVPDYPVATLTFDTVEGTFTFNDGTVKNLTGGRGALSVRQWHAYPNILPRELYSDEAMTGEKFDTL